MEEHDVGSLTESSTAEPVCRHHWLIEPPNGPTSTGVCKLCGSTKEFDNQMPSRAVIVPQTPAQKSPQSSDDQVLTASQKH